MKIEVTKHAESRIRERLGVPKRAIRGLAKKAYYDGAELDVRCQGAYGKRNRAMRGLGIATYIYAVYDKRAVLLTVTTLGWSKRTHREKLRRSEANYQKVQKLRKKRRRRNG